LAAKLFLELKTELAKAEDRDDAEMEHYC